MVVLRKRKQPEPSAAQGDGVQGMLDAAASASNLVIFTGSGLSATSGMSTFSTKGGLYERAQKRFGVTDGKKLFTYSFFEKQRLEAMAFYADIYAEAKRARPSAGHGALAAIAAMGKLQRHYTMNIDGLAESVGLTTWHPDTNPSGQTLEMHGNIHELVCPECGDVSAVTPTHLHAMRAKRPLRCGRCGDADLRCRVMLYDDGEADVITPEEVFDVLEDDVAAADMILWVGISFQQSASTAYFRRVRHFLQDAGRLQKCKQVVVNLSEDCLWNLFSALSNTDDLHVIEVLASSDEALPKLAACLAQSPAAAQQQPPPPLCPLLTQPRSPLPDSSPSRFPEVSLAPEVYQAGATAEPMSIPESHPASSAAHPVNGAAAGRPEFSAQPPLRRQTDLCEPSLNGWPAVKRPDEAQQQASLPAEDPPCSQPGKCEHEPSLVMQGVTNGASVKACPSALCAADVTGQRMVNGTAAAAAQCSEADDELTQNVPENIPRPLGATASIATEAASGLTGPCREQAQGMDVSVARDIYHARGAGEGLVKIDPHRLAPAGPLPAS